MKSIYQTIWVEMPYEAVQITEVTVRQAFNSHACLRLAAVVAQEGRDGAMELAAERETVRAGFLGAEGAGPFFSGRITEAVWYEEKGQTMLSLTCMSQTYAWDIAQIGRASCRERVCQYV